MKIKNIKSAILYQIKSKDWVQQIFTKRNAWGIFSKWSHQRKDGKLKQKYNTEASALRASESMERKYGGRFRCYKCLFCDGFHVGKPLKS